MKTYPIKQIWFYFLPESVLATQLWVTDGRMTLIIAPWKMSNFEGAGIDRPGLEHVGFEVESVPAVKNELAALREANAEMRERILSEPSEGARRVALIASCRHGPEQLSSPTAYLSTFQAGELEARKLAR
ncbi:MAG: hypothetical protein ACTHMB_00595 [Candidatus Binatia bacterium]